ncbi:BC1881 family protein [Terribacillus sp. 179-K 1B1 HS]|uniref:BC1881 family protein n=1 Tax=Terribacillus sp. 179-K 1B1 HS TaxID=3142388 RepID=UPI00399FC55B
MAGKQGEQRESIEELAEETNKNGQVTMKIGLDVSEALTGLKAVERQAKAAKRAVAELEDGSYAVTRRWDGEGGKDTDYVYNYPLNIPKQLSDYSTKELADELAKREGIEEFEVKPHEGYATIAFSNGLDVSNMLRVDGPARIVVNRD